jgi:hypothetical protein
MIKELRVVVLDEIADRHDIWDAAICAAACALTPKAINPQKSSEQSR